MSCSIDILISSNLERLLFELSGRDAETVSSWMQQLRECGRYEIGESRRAALSSRFAVGWCSEEDTLKTIRRIHDVHRYLMDPHTAVAQTVYERYAARTGDATPTVLLSTANPYKFATDVLSAFETPARDDFVNADRLHALTGTRIPDGISGLHGKKERHLDVCSLDEMRERVLGGVQNHEG